MIGITHVARRCRRTWWYSCSCIWGLVLVPQPLDLTSYGGSPAVGTKILEPYMDIFHGNQQLEEAVLYALDWGLFLRHDLEGPIIPFLYLFDGTEMRTRVLVTDGDPVDYAARVLAEEEKPFRQFVIGMEGYIQEEEHERVDAIIVQGFDRSQKKGVTLAQMFSPKEQGGGFKKIDKASFLGHPKLPIPLEPLDDPDYTAEEMGFNAIALKVEGLIQYLAFFTHPSPSVVANAIRKFLRSKLSDPAADTLNGRFDLQLTPGSVSHHDFLKFLVRQAVEDEKKSPHGQAWEQQTGRKIQVNVTQGGHQYLVEVASDKADEKKPNAGSDTGEGLKYAALSAEGLRGEFQRIISMPNARTNVEALTDMAALMKEYERRGLPMPNAQPKAKPNKPKKPWWKFW